MPQRLAIFALWLLPNLSSSVPPARVEDVRFPADAGVVDVTEAPYNATGDGKTDATAALQKALTDHPSGNRIIYLPNGTYLVSDTLRWPMGKPGGGDDCKRVILQGQSRLGTVIKLKDNCPGFSKPLADPRYKRPTGKGVIWTGKAPAQRFRNGVRNLTIDTGRGNAGACGLQFIANNSGCVRHVLIRSGDGRGVNGLNLPVKATPEVPWDPPGQWVSPLQFGGKPGDKVDDTAAIQRAIDSGKTTVYLPNGRWVVRGDLLLRGKVRRFIGCE